MQTIERVILTALLRDMRAAGYQPAAVWDGGDYVMAAGSDVRSFDAEDAPLTISRALTDDEALEAIDSVDVSTLHFTRREAQTWGNRGALLVLGNGEDVISDHHAPDGDEPFSGIFTAISERIEKGLAP